MAELIVLNHKDLQQLLSLETVIPVIERGFVALADRRAVMYPVIREQVSGGRAIFGIKSGYLIDEDVVGLKAGGFWVDNPAAGLAAHQSTTLIFDPRTGLPTALMDGNHITLLRTAAVGALAARHLSSEAARVAAVVGCGTQGTAEAEALRHVRPIAEIRAFDAVRTQAERLAEALRARGVAVHVAGDAEEAVRGADVVVTATPGNAVVLRAEWVRPGMHVSAFGTDTAGKVEIESALFAKATVVVDDIAQATTIGETQHPIAEGVIRVDNIHGTLGGILAGRKPGRVRPDEITLFDATGLAFQDLACGRLALQLAASHGVGQRVLLS